MSAAVESVWKFTEVNEWEGETWVSFFTASGLLVTQLEKLSGVLDSDEHSPYSLEKVDSMPETFYEGPDECEYGYEDGEECGDCAYCCGDESYFLPEQEMETPHIERVNAAIKFWESPDANETSDPLYKMGLFDQI